MKSAPHEFVHGKTFWLSCAVCGMERNATPLHDKPPLNPDALAQLIMWKELPFGGNPDSYIRLDANAAHKVIELLKPHLAVTQPEVTSVEELDALPVESVIEDDDGCIFEIVHNGERNSDGTFYREYMMTGDTHAYSIDEIDLPATLLKRAPETPRR